MRDQSTSAGILDPHHLRDNAELTEAGDIHQCWNAAPPSDHFVRSAELVKIVDGDTLRLQIDQGWNTTITDDVRLIGINTPENRGNERLAGLWVTEQVRQWFAESPLEKVIIRSEKFNKGKFGRCICSCWLDGVSLNQWLLDRKYGWPTKANGGIDGPRNIELLDLPESIIDEVRRLTCVI